MSEIVFYSKRGNGGYGDRIVGISAVWCLSKILNKTFRIVWDEDLSLIFSDYEKYIPSNFEGFTRINWIDSRCKNAEKFFEETSFCELLQTNYLIECNQPVHTFFWTKKGKELFPGLTLRFNFNELYHSSFQVIYSQILKLLPLPKSINLEIDVSIQMRCGDCYSSGNNHCYILEEKFNTYAKNCKDALNSHPFFTNKKEKSIFISSDCHKVYPIFVECFSPLPSEEKISTFFLEKERDTHFDMSIDEKEEFAQLIYEHYLLSRGKIMVTSFSSNFGITAALCGGMKEVIILHYDGYTWKTFEFYNLFLRPRCKSRIPEEIYSL